MKKLCTRSIKIKHSICSIEINVKRRIQGRKNKKVETDFSYDSIEKYKLYTLKIISKSCFSHKEIDTKYSLHRDCLVQGSEKFSLSLLGWLKPIL